jgi:16S rRNA C1402 (ribose-2'-O) methylase RsmI
MALKKVQILQKVDLVICEDSRVAQKLLSQYQIFDKKFCSIDIAIWNEQSAFENKIYHYYTENWYKIIVNRYRQRITDVDFTEITAARRV